MNGTYTQRRRRQMAGGGITSLQNRPGYFLGGIGDFFGGIKDKIVDDLIPNEIKESPVGAAVLGGALVNQFGIPGIPGDVGEAFGQNWLGELLGNVPGVQGGTVDMVLGGGGGGQSIMDIFRPVTETVNPLPSQAWGGLENLVYGMPGDKTGIEGLSWGGIDAMAKQKLSEMAAQQIKEKTGVDLTGGTTAGTTSEQELQRRALQNINWQTPLAVGLAAGAAQKAMSEGDVLPQDTTGLDLAGIRAAALQGPEAAKAAGLHFLPPASATTAYADGGRIGYYGGGSLDAGASDIKYEGDMRMASGPYEGTAADADEHSYRMFGKPYKALNKIELEEFRLEMERLQSKFGAAEGGRIGYDEGGLGFKTNNALNQKSLDLFGVLFNFLNDKQKKSVTQRVGNAQGGRIGAQEGGLMDLGGMEKDYRQEGGFVPIGGQEKADDVPARLSKNEFVFTADAVRAAGGGDIDEGAAVMERLMDNLEAGGKVSKESQGLEGAQEMFANTQRLQNRII